MRWFHSFIFISLMALVLSDKPNLLVRAPRIRQSLIKFAVQPAIASGPVAVTSVEEPLIKLAVQPAIASEPVAETSVEESPEEEEEPVQIAPVQTGRRIRPYVGPQYWPRYQPRYEPESWYGYRPFWGGYGQVRQPRRWAPRYWGPRVVVPAEVSTVGPVAAVIEPEVVEDVVANTDADEATPELA